MLDLRAALSVYLRLSVAEHRYSEDGLLRNSNRTSLIQVQSKFKTSQMNVFIPLLMDWIMVLEVL
jgi:hypothetical protein